jgi:hypothetical protein
MDHISVACSDYMREQEAVMQNHSGTAAGWTYTGGFTAPGTGGIFTQ